MISSPSKKLQATEYAIGVTTHTIIASKKVFLACQRHLKDLERQGTEKFPYVFDEDAGYRPIQFIEKFCKPSQGDFSRLELDGWQHFCVGSLYGWVHKDTRLRRFKEGLIFVARKNGKTTLTSGLSLYAAAKDGEKGARVFQLANSKEQAREMFEECKAMVESSPLLNRHFEARQHEIRFPKTISTIKPLATDSKKLDGKNTSFGAFDEIHEYKDYKLINVIKNSRGSRKQPLIVYITTAGTQLDGPLIDYYEHGTDVLEGIVDDERSFYFMAELDDPKEIDNPEMWGKANPSLGKTQQIAGMIDDWDKVKHIPGEKNDFITKRLNLFVKSDEQSFLSYEVLKRNNKVVDIDFFAGATCIGAFDLSETEDFTSACLEFPMMATGEVFALSHSWIPRKKVIADNEKINYEAYAKAGLLTIVEGEYVRHELVYDWFVAMSSKYSIQKIAYDPAKAYRLVQDLIAFGFPMEIVRQGALTLSDPLKDLKNLFLDGKVIFNNNKLLRWYINNVKLKEDRNRNWLPTKQNRYRKIDGFAALLNAHTEVVKLMAQPQSTGQIKSMSFSELLGRR
ncbi:phage-terminase large subunit [Fictibacillus macauensis ZFHKF-1]|uniref:Phage-terminase large subunit n=1 Tax=Fictibacillus macauensis ZFHKF-1 TaxID=1196324 RepID=I8AJF0_9BACL|nr:terminase large subunit [Fictibacillus macauensis]EIT85917.1 phage-terminase large subunit [Fictibacillus macauensis ZFHKF-1]